jgi:hypothetical protein
LRPPVKQATTAEEVVKERSQARWDAMVKGDFMAGYEYLSPAGKSVYSEAQYEERVIILHIFTKE